MIPAAPGLVVAAPSSGSGKTTVTTGLMAALAAGGAAVAPFKVGPDYIDPGYHALATGRPGRNLDPVLVGDRRIAPLYAHGAAGCDVGVVEGAMGLFDGRVDDADPAAAVVPPGSAAHVAGLLGLPVVLVVDVRGYSQTLAAVVRGLGTHDPGTRIAGVILNRVGSERHTAILTAACESAGVPVLGAVPRDAGLEVPSRHLGLVTVAEHAGRAEAAVAEMGRIVGEHVDLAALRGLAARPAPVEPWDPVTEIARAGGAHRAPGEGPGAGDETGVRGPDDEAGDRVTIALAGGPAFTFAYAEHAELLAAAGARVVTVDPLVDRALPADTAGLVLPGGFPEEHVAALAGNTGLVTVIADLVRTGMPVHAECAGLLYLGRTLAGRDGAEHALSGVLDVDGRFGPRLTLGYRDAVATGDSVLFRAGERVAGHEFHRTTVAPTGGERAPSAWAWRDRFGARVDEGIVSGSVHASYLHVHPAGHPEAVARFVDAARAWRASQGARVESGDGEVAG